MNGASSPNPNHIQRGDTRAIQIPSGMPNTRIKRASASNCLIPRLRNLWFRMLSMMFAWISTPG